MKKTIHKAKNALNLIKTFIDLVDSNEPSTMKMNHKQFLWYAVWLL